jgi:hypothetical protein
LGASPVGLDRAVNVRHLELYAEQPQRAALPVRQGARQRKLSGLAGRLHVFVWRGQRDSAVGEMRQRAELNLIPAPGDDQPFRRRRRRTEPPDTHLPEGAALFGKKPGIGCLGDDGDKLVCRHQQRLGRGGVADGGSEADGAVITHHPQRVDPGASEGVLYFLPTRCLIARGQRPRKFVRLRGISGKLRQRAAGEINPMIEQLRATVAIGCQQRGPLPLLHPTDDQKCCEKSEKQQSQKEGKAALNAHRGR